MYILRTNSDGAVIGAADQYDQTIDKKHANWPDVERWAAALVPSVDLAGNNFPPNGVLVFDKVTLTDFCRRHGIMLHAATDNISIGASQTFNGIVWLSLDRAVAVQPEQDIPQNPAGITRLRSGIWVPFSLPETFRHVFEGNEENEHLWCVSSRTVKRAFVYLDVSGFSKYGPGQQALIISTLIGLVNHPRYWQMAEAHDAYTNMEAQLCIGDGYIFVFPDPLKATFFACWMAELIQQLVARRGTGPDDFPIEFHFRMGVHYGPVYRFWDPGSYLPLTFSATCREDFDLTRRRVRAMFGYSALPPS
jgi:hypothetical protein